MQKIHAPTVVAASILTPLREHHTFDNEPPIHSSPVANVKNHSLLQELLEQNKELIRCLTATKIKSDDRSRRNATGPIPGQPRTPSPQRYNKYCWTHGRCNRHYRTLMITATMCPTILVVPLG